VASPDIRRILCPIDASEPSALALRHAVAVARWSGASLTMLHVSAPERLRVAGREPEDTEAAIQKWMEDQFQSVDGTGVCVQLIARTGAPARGIVACAAQLPADLIILGTHGAGGFERLVLGSVAEKVLRTAPCPVLTVPPREAGVSRVPFQHVLCALDFSECSLAALEYAMAVAVGSGAALTLAHVIEWPWVEPPAPVFSELPALEAAALAEFRQRREQQAREHLAGFVPETLAERCRTRISHGRAHAELLKLAVDEHADLIVLGVHGRNPLDMAMFGSTTHQVVRRATCPVLTVRR
jgi:nucleotide-binding universal stress UspA family protein